MLVWGCFWSMCGRRVCVCFIMSLPKEFPTSANPSSASVPRELLMQEPDGLSLEETRLT